MSGPNRVLPTEPPALVRDDLSAVVALMIASPIGLSIWVLGWMLFTWLR